MYRDTEAQFWLPEINGEVLMQICHISVYSCTSHIKQMLHVHVPFSVKREWSCLTINKYLDLLNYNASTLYIVGACVVKLRTVLFEKAAFNYSVILYVFYKIIHFSLLNIFDNWTSLSWTVHADKYMYIIEVQHIILPNGFTICCLPKSLLVLPHLSYMGNDS